MTLAPTHPLFALFRRPIAHRGLHELQAGRVENTASAFRAALEHGFGIECDVQRSVDGEAMVFHDFTLDRLTGARGPLADRPAEELEQLAIAGGKDRIIRLAALLDLVAGRVPLVIEIKSRFDGDLRLAERVAKVIEGYAGPIALKSFDPGVVAGLRQHTAAARGIVGMNDVSHHDFAALLPADRAALPNLGHLGRSQPDFLSWRAQDLVAAAPLFARLVPSLPVMSWTIRSVAQASEALRHADQIVFEGFLPDANETAPPGLV